MIDGKHNNNGKGGTSFSVLFLINSLIMISFCIRSSSAIALPPSVERLRETVFPRVTVSIRNEASRAVYLKCGFSRGSEEEGSERREPGEVISTAFYEILFPLRWCYLHVNNQIRGAFWAFSVNLQCTNCTWSIRDDGPYHFQAPNNTWVKNPLFLD